MYVQESKKLLAVKKQLEEANQALANSVPKADLEALQIELSVAETEIYEQNQRLKEREQLLQETQAMLEKAKKY